MAFIDEIKLHIRAGKGGNGVERWRREKFIERGGPAGGDGGKGGDVYMRACRDLSLLGKYRHIKEFRAERGQDGMKKCMHGKNGEDLTIDLPVGSIVKNLATGEKIEFYKEGEIVKVLSGGLGGFGNDHFKSSTNISPKEWTPGKPGEEADFFIELELIADAGLIGLPNAGKSSLLNALTRSSAKVAGYQFTTLEPNLGDFYGFILTDIPGLIEGASEGKGLGHRFLKHIKRTKMLIHLVSLENENPVSVYDTVRNELEKFDEELLKKPEIVVLTKTDMVDKKVIAKVKKELSKRNKNIYQVSVINDGEIKDFGDTLVSILRK